MSLRPEILSIYLCPICGKMATKGAACACGARRNIRGWFEGEQPAEVEEATALLRSVVKMIPRQDGEGLEEWLARTFDLVGHIHLLIEGEK